MTARLVAGLPALANADSVRPLYFANAWLFLSLFPPNLYFLQLYDVAWLWAEKAVRQLSKTHNYCG